MLCKPSSSGGSIEVNIPPTTDVETFCVKRGEGENCEEGIAFIQTDEGGTLIGYTIDWANSSPENYSTFQEITQAGIMKYAPVSKATETFTYKHTMYIANQDDPGGTFLKGEPVCKTTQLRESDMSATGEVAWINIAQDTTIAAPADLTLLTAGQSGANIRQQLGTELITTVPGTPQTLATIPAGANHAEFSVMDQDVLVCADGTSVVGNAAGPGVEVGQIQNCGTAHEAESIDEINNYQVDSRGDQPARVKVTYYCILGGRNV